MKEKLIKYTIIFEGQEKIIYRNKKYIDLKIGDSVFLYKENYNVDEEVECIISNRKRNKIFLD